MMGAWDERLTLRIERLALGGAGIARHEGRVVFVEGGLPGDEVLARVYARKERFLRARALSILTPSPDRRSSPCPFAEQCGGCPWICLLEPAQEQARAELVRGAMAHVGRVKEVLQAPLERAPHPLGYRCRARLWAVGDRLGFRRSLSNEVVDIPSCLVLRPALNDLLARVRNVLEPLRPLESPLRIELLEADSGRLSVGVCGRSARHFPRVLGNGSMVLRRVVPATDEVPLLLPFSQANLEQNRRMVQAVGQALALGASERLLDLYCGSGNFVLAFAERLESALGIEVDEAAVAAGAAVAPKNVQLRQGRVEAELMSLLRSSERFTRVVLDPPRGGAAFVCQHLHETQATTAVYVSCDPVTLARDLAILRANGWELKCVTPWDLMPQTAQVECVAVLER